MAKLTPHVVAALKSLDGAYLPDELAYLALTQKVEHAFRDSLAFKLHQLLQAQPDLLVCREWHRTDLAVVRDAQPLLLLEVKAIYTFDILKSGAQHPYPELLQQDIEKSQAWQIGGNNSTLEVLALLVATRPHDPPSSAYREAVKYYGGVVKYATTSNNVAAAHAEVQRRVNLSLVHHAEVQGGRAFGVGVSVAYWLFKPR
jgi:hypothetical protein